MSDPTYLTLFCNCTMPMAIRFDTMEHGLLAGWKCPSCKQTKMLSALTAHTEDIRACPDYFEEGFCLRHAVFHSEMQHGRRRTSNDALAPHSAAATRTVAGEAIPPTQEPLARSASKPQPSPVTPEGAVNTTAALTNATEQGPRGGSK